MGPAKIEVRFQPLPRLRHVPDDGQERDLLLRRRLQLVLMRSGRVWPHSTRKSRRPTLISLNDTEQISIALCFVSRVCFKNAIFTEAKNAFLLYGFLGPLRSRTWWSLM